MGWFVLGLIVGLMIGGGVGMIMAALLAAGRDEVKPRCPGDCAECTSCVKMDGNA